VVINHPSSLPGLQLSTTITHKFLSLTQT